MPTAIQYIMFILLLKITAIDYHTKAQPNRFLQSFPETTEKEKDQKLVPNRILPRLG